MFSDKITKLVAEDAKKVVAGRVKQSAEQGAMVNSGTPEPVQSTPTVKPTASSNDVLVMGGQGRGNITTGDVDRASAAMGKAVKKYGAFLKTSPKNIKRGVAAVGAGAGAAGSRLGRIVAQGVTRIFKSRGS